MAHGEYPEADRGRCRSCGFLSKHARQASGLPSPRFYEVEHSERESPPSFLSHMVTTYGLPAVTEPMCFMDATNLMAVLENEGDAKLVEAILSDRQCNSWQPYMPGRNPMEHYEEFAMLRLEADRRAYEERTEESRRRYEKDMAEAAEADRRRFDVANESRNRALIIASIIIGGIIGIAQIIAAFILNRESFTDQIMRKLAGH
jgi:hypothetical protein